MPIEVESPEELGYEQIECNLAESSVRDVSFGLFRNVDLSSLVLAYGSHKGHHDLRSAIAEEAGVSADDVLLVPGAAAGLFIIATSMLTKDDELVVVHPNYATNLETPKAIGATIHEVNLTFEEGFKTVIENILKYITPQTSYVSITTPHNPTGIMIREDELSSLISSVCSEKGKHLLIDETYRYMTFHKPSNVGAGQNEKVISVASMSKAFGLPGIRIGWIITRDKKLMEKFLAAKEQIVICNSVIDEELAWLAFKDREQYLKPVKQWVERNFTIVEEWLSVHNDLEWVKPDGGVVCFPRFKRPSEMDTDKFYRILFEKYKTCVGPGHWFGMPDRYMRIGFGWPGEKELKNGLDRIDSAIHESRVKK